MTIFLIFLIIGCHKQAAAGRVSLSVQEKMKKRFSKVLLGFVFVLFFLGCQRSRKSENFILVTLDTQRADYISAYNPSNASTPNIDFLAREGTLFKNAYSLIPMTLPSHGSIFFSERPHKIKCYNNGQKVIAKRSMPSFVNLFRQKGFATAAFVSLGIVEAQFGLDQGFDLYQDSFPRDRWYLSAGEVNERVFSWLEKNKDRPFFLWVHYSDPHDPYAPPYVPLDFKLYLNDRLIYETSLQKYTLNQVTLDLKPGKNRVRIEFKNEFDRNANHYLGFLDRLEFSPVPDQKELKTNFVSGWFFLRPENIFFKGKSFIDITNNSKQKQVQFTFQGKPWLSRQAARVCYGREVEYMDGAIGKLWEKLRELRLFDKTAILLVGDHGEGLGEYHYESDPHFGHIHFLYDLYMKVPLIIWNPSQPKKGIVREEFVNLLDIAPTIIKMMGLNPFSSFQGRDLSQLKTDEKATLFEETYKPESVRDRFGIISFPWHLIFTPEDNKLEVFNLKKDPQEMTDISSGQEVSEDLLPLKLKLEAYSREALSGKGEIKIDEKTKEMLRALGYIR